MQHRTLRACLGSPVEAAHARLCAVSASVPLNALHEGTSLGGALPSLAGRSVLLRTCDQLTAALAMIELDGVVRRLIICPPDLAAAHLPDVLRKADVDAIVSDVEDPGDPGGRMLVRPSAHLTPVRAAEIKPRATEWVLLTSGTTGAPKMLAHDLAALTGAIQGGRAPGLDIVWGTFYDIRRYGGLQIFLRAVLGQRSLVLSDAAESANDFLLRLAGRGVTHLTGTPSHWRRALMCPAARSISPRYVRLSGEIADQAILNSLRAFFPEAAVGHAFASTEAGVSFEVNDGLEGFPRNRIGRTGDVEIKVVDGSLRIRSNRTARSYLGEEGLALTDAECFVDTGDMVELRGDRYYFLGRRTGVINVGGLKVYPEEIESLINLHPAVRMSRVRAKSNPISGALVVADVVLKVETAVTNGTRRELEQEILKICRNALPRHKTPAMLRFVPGLAVAQSGKLARSHA